MSRGNVPIQGEEPREREEEGCRQTITDINKHAAAVMRAAGDTGREPAGESISGMADQVLDDLRRPELAGFSQLRIQDPRRLHSSAGPPQISTLPHQGTGAVSSLTDRDALNAAEVGLWLSVCICRHRQPSAVVFKRSSRDGRDVQG